MRFWSIASALLSAMVLASGCGYHLKSSKSSLVDRESIRRVYVTSFKNDTYKPGVENLAYNALIKRLSAQSQLTLVQRLEDADAIIDGSVFQADRVVSSESKASDLNPKGQGPDNVLVANEYTALLGCSLSLIRRNPAAGRPGVIWSSSFSRSKPFPGNNQIGNLGTTSALINESEFDRALGEMVDHMMADAHEAMLDTF